MPTTVTELDNGLGNIIKGEGHLAAEEYHTAILEHLSKPEEQLEKYLYSIVDFTNVTKFDINMGYIKKIAAESIRVSKINPHVIVAIATRDQILYSVMSMWTSLVRLTGWNIKIFKNRLSLDAWIHETVKDNFNIINLELDS